MDQIASGVDDGNTINDGNKRLMIVAAGNSDEEYISSYPDSQLTDSVNDPAQSWNALTVGAYTQLTEITDPTFSGYEPVAQVNQLSPFSTTSLDWDKDWPIKPEIVMEGGNAAINRNKSTEHNRLIEDKLDDLCLLSTFFEPKSRLLERFNKTSAATALAAHFAAQVQVQYPDYWPETIRALMVHSAEWPDELKNQFIKDETKKGEIGKLLRVCGYGVPDLNRAIYSAANSLTLISQAEIQPYEKRDGAYKTKEMHLYDLPWPREVLEELGETDLEMRITLSYFIEPGPGEIGWKDRYRYPSHLLRFDIKSPRETEVQFVKRINKAQRDENEGHPGTGSASDYWTIGQARDKGSIHSDIWKGSAIDLAASSFIAVFPGTGWWKERNHLRRFESKTRYSLIVTIKTQEQDIDIYTPVAQKIGLIIPVRINGNRR